jgi:hypothetical protein
VKNAIFFGGNVGPKAIPGSYQVKLNVDKWNQTQSFELKKDPRLSTTPEDIRAQFDLAIQVRDKVTEVHDTIQNIRDVCEQIENLSDLAGKAERGKDVTQAASILTGKLKSIEEKLIQARNECPLDTCNFPPQLDNHFLNVLDFILSADFRPTERSYECFEDLQREWAGYVSQLQEIFDKELTAFNEMVRKENIAPVIVPRNKEDYPKEGGENE